MKITQYGHGVCSLNGEPCFCDPGEHGFALTEERDRQGRGDTKRFLQAGARRSLWLRVRQGQLHRAMPALLRSLRPDKWVMIESNSIVGFLDPALYLFLLDHSTGDFKASAQKYLERADVLVTIGSLGGINPWPDIEARLLAEKPIVSVSRPEYASEDLTHLVRVKLGLIEASEPVSA